MQIRLGGNSGGNIGLRLAMANRHGLIAGATGTGKTVTLQVLAEGFSRQGVPVFLADVKGDLSGLARANPGGDKIRARVEELGLADYQARAYPVVLWDLYSSKGHPLRTTVSDLGPLLLANLLQLNDTQTAVLQAAFRIADDQGLLLLDLKDLRALLAWMSDHGKQLAGEYGSLSGASIAAIQRGLLALDSEGGSAFLGEPEVALADLMRTDFSGNGVISVLDASALMSRPKLYAMFLLWLIAELFEQLPEVGDPDKPRLVFFFDEAHLLFDDAPPTLLDRIEQVVRLIRSKGVGVYFVTQNPLDIPDTVLGQLGNRVQHALRAFTPRDRKAVRAAAQTFRPNPELDTEQVITELGVGEALLSVLDEKGIPTPVQRVLICPPESRIGPLTAAERDEHLSRSPLAGRYDQALDRESAYEVLKAKVAAATSTAAPAPGERPAGRQSVLEAMTKSAARALGSHVGRQLARGLLGSLLGNSRRR